MFSRVLLGCVFVFSGFVKIIDPLGTAYKISDYLTAFGWTFLQSVEYLPLALSIALSTTEFILGLALLFRLRFRHTSLIVLLFMLFMTPLTLYIALTNPVADCGCFGDAIVLSNWATLGKNIVLLTCAICIFVKRKNIYAVLNHRAELLVLSMFLILSVGLFTYSLLRLPLLDFRPYKIGTDINLAMEIPEDAERDQYETTFVYAQNGHEQAFTLDNYPKNDSTWVFVRQHTRLIKKGYEPAIKDLIIYNSDFDDVTYEILHTNHDVMLVVMYDLQKVSEKHAAKINTLYQESLQSDTPFYVLTASSDVIIDDFKFNNAAQYEFCTADPIVLKTMIRANPGVIQLKNGVVMDKWNIREL